MSTQPLDVLHAPFHSWNTSEYHLERLAQIGLDTYGTLHSLDS